MRNKRTYHGDSMSTITIRHQSSGFTLIEILVSMVILAIGLLGLASLQILSLKDNQDAYLYSQATALAYDMSDRIKVNRLGWAGGPVAPATNCLTNLNACGVGADCTPAAMAADDYCIWQANAANKLANGVTATVYQSPVTGSSVCTGAAPALCIQLVWTGGHASSSKYEMEMRP